jgi:hypothetical protein
MKTNIKTKMLFIAFAAMILFTMTTYAAGPVSIAAQNIRQTLVKAVEQPKDIETLPVTGEVVVLFTVSDEGNIEIKKLDATNEEIAAFIKEKMASLQLREFVHPYNQYFRVKFRFSQV